MQTQLCMEAGEGLSYELVEGRRNQCFLRKEAGYSKMINLAWQDVIC